MRKVIALMIVMFLIGCQNIPVKPIETYSLNGWKIIYNADTFQLCGNKAGCAFLRTKTIYCNLDDFIVCGHELKHITHGDFHKER